MKVQAQLSMKKKETLVVFGISGSGKTQFINSFKNLLENKGDFWSSFDRTRASKGHNIPFDEFPLHFVDTPGHSGNGLDRQNEIRNIIASGVEGIINVVSYGYEENPEIDPTTLIDHSTGEIKPAFITNNRISEKERLKEWLPLIQPNKDLKWIINLVNKADLWWPEVNEVTDYYVNLDYGETFDGIRAYTRVVCLPYCSIIKPYFGTKTSGIFGDKEKHALNRALLNELLSLLKHK